MSVKFAVDFYPVISIKIQITGLVLLSNKQAHLALIHSSVSFLNEFYLKRPVFHFVSPHDTESLIHGLSVHSRGENVVVPAPDPSHLVPNNAMNGFVNVLIT